MMTNVSAWQGLAVCEDMIPSALWEEGCGVRPRPTEPPWQILPVRSPGFTVGALQTMVSTCAMWRRQGSKAGTNNQVCTVRTTIWLSTKKPRRVATNSPSYPKQLISGVGVAQGLLSSIKRFERNLGSSSPLLWDLVHVSLRWFLQQPNAIMLRVKRFCYVVATK